jgi:hypothetical protein
MGVSGSNSYELFVAKSTILKICGGDMERDG